MSIASLIFLLHLAATLFMCSLIWFVQLVHPACAWTQTGTKFDSIPCPTVRGMGFLFLIASVGIASADEQAVYSTHLAWKAAFEKADLAAVNPIWSHAADTTLITLGGKRRDGFEKIFAELALSFQLTGETLVSESDLLITLSGEDFV